MNKNLVLILIILLLSGCALTRQPQIPVAVYDFGLQQSPYSTQTTKIPQTKIYNIQVPEATSPLWLDNQAIHYRLSYHNAAESYTYANSRWTAAPAALFTQIVRQRIVSDTHNQITNDNDHAKTDYILHMDLGEFTQVFDTINNSRAVISLRTSLIERRTRLLLAQNNFSMEETAPTANAAGAVHALTISSSKLVDKLIDWLSQELANR
tara:strand:+ start:609 stop:1235 length:627 start_codon:yes stop_codon:yes gene_type:complete